MLLLLLLDRVVTCTVRRWWEQGTRCHTSEFTLLVTHRLLHSCHTSDATLMSHISCFTPMSHIRCYTHVVRQMLQSCHTSVVLHSRHTTDATLVVTQRMLQSCHASDAALVSYISLFCKQAQLCSSLATSVMMSSTQITTSTLSNLSIAAVRHCLRASGRLLVSVLPQEFAQPCTCRAASTHTLPAPSQRHVVPSRRKNG